MAMERMKRAEAEQPAPPAVEEQGKILWRKTGRGSFRFKGQIIKPNQTFRARPDEISLAFRDIITPVEGLPPEPPLEVAKPGYRIQPSHTQQEMFDVVDMQGKQMNEKPLTEKGAEILIKELRG